MLQSFIMLDPILLVNMLTYDAFITSYNDFFAEPMAGEDDDDIIIPAVFIGQDGKLWVLLLHFNSLTYKFFVCFSDGLKIQSFYQYYDGYWL